MTDQSRREGSILLVCMGNICRSPMAEGVLRQRVMTLDSSWPLRIDSAGTHSYHAGAAPDRRAQEAALRRGIDISDLRARPVGESDFEQFDVILAMDRDNLAFLHEAAMPEHRAKIRLLLDYSRDRAGGEVPDPYYGGPSGFERVMDLVEEAVDGLLAELLRERQPSG